jgi:hypothetical protein
MRKRPVKDVAVKDFYDVWLLSRHYDFDGTILAGAVGRTFANRKTAIPEVVLALTPAFADADKQTQWLAFLRRSRLETAPVELRDVVESLAGFLGPVAAAIRQPQQLSQRWKAPGPWD